MPQVSCVCVLLIPREFKNFRKFYPMKASFRWFLLVLFALCGLVFIPTPHEVLRMYATFVGNNTAIHDKFN